MSPRSTCAALCLLLVGCPKQAPLPESSDTQAAAQAALARKAAEIVQQTKAAQAARDAALWSRWTNGTALDFTAAFRGREALLTRESLETLEHARATHAYDADEITTARALLVAEAVSRAIADADAAVANLEASLSFTFGDKEVQLRELQRSLIAERSQSRRQELWSKALTVAPRLDEALAQRDAAVDRALLGLGLMRDGWASELRDADLEAAAQWADSFLAATDAVWRDRLAAWVAREMKSAPTAADLPLMLRTPTGLDAAFAKTKAAERATTLLSQLQLYGLSGLILELSEQPSKVPLPLTVVLRAPTDKGDADVRMSYRPTGGAKDQQALLAEVGRALAQRFAPFGRGRVVEPTAELFASLMTDPLWLSEQGVAGPLATSQAAAAADARLLSLRRWAGQLLSTLSAADFDDERQAAAYVTHVGRALGVPLTSADAKRRRIERAELYGEIDLLRAQAEAFALRDTLVAGTDGRWWAAPDTANRLKHYWRTGHLDGEAAARASSAAALLSAVGVTAGPGLTASWGKPATPAKPASAPTDGGAAAP